MQIFEFTASSPPTDKQFEVIAQRLFIDLCEQTGVTFEVLRTHIESGSWVTLNIRSCSIHKNLIDIVLDGIISYSLRADEAPNIDSVLLPFSGGKRLSVGRNTVLVANYVEYAAGGKWEQFTWEVDGYGEWECEERPGK